MSNINEYAAEERVAQSLARLRAEAGLTYEALAQKLMGLGIRIHPSAIQKTEKSGRKPTIREMVAYARVFNVPVVSLWGGKLEDAGFSAGMRDLSAAERILGIARNVRSEYEQVVGNLAEQAAASSYLREQLMNRLIDAAYTALFSKRWDAGADEDAMHSISYKGWDDLSRMLEEEIPEENSIEIEVLKDALGLNSQQHDTKKDHNGK